MRKIKNIGTVAIKYKINIVNMSSNFIFQTHFHNTAKIKLKML